LGLAAFQTVDYWIGKKWANRLVYAAKQERHPVARSFLNICNALIGGKGLNAACGILCCGEIDDSDVPSPRTENTTPDEGVPVALNSAQDILKGKWTLWGLINPIPYYREDEESGETAEFSAA